jgi:phospholipid/cholesterol/gamma-HCH transport system permease protein
MSSAEAAALSPKETRPEGEAVAKVLAEGPTGRTPRVADALISAGRIDVTLSGAWQMSDGLEQAARINDLLGAPGIRQLGFRDAGLRGWDSALLTFVLDLKQACDTRGIAFDQSGLPEGVRRLVELATAVPERTGTRQGGGAGSFLASVGKWGIAEWKTAGRAMRFLGESMIGFFAFLSGRARYRSTDLWLAIQECGAQALPIVTVISLLIGMIFAFVGAVQLKQFGADIYVANLVAVAMAREMSAVMTGIVLAGRTGAAFAAQIGAMQGNEEIDALSTLGISPIEFLVVPRMLALIVMTPLLCIYANLMGILGGFIVGVGMLNVTPVAYVLQTQSAIGLTDIAIGIVKSAVFGVLIAITGCLRGMEAGRSAAAVGEATTGAVVSGILYIIVADAVFAVLLNVLGI